MHDAPRRDAINAQWLAVRAWPCGYNGERRRLVPDLGLLQQPLEQVPLRTAQLEWHAL